MLLDEKLAGLPGTAFVLVTLDQQGRAALDAFESAINRHPEVTECCLLAGTADYMVRVAYADGADFERIHTEILTQLPGVVRVQSTLALRTACGKCLAIAAGGLRSTSSASMHAYSGAPQLMSVRSEPGCTTSASDSGIVKSSTGTCSTELR